MPADRMSRRPDALELERRASALWPRLDRRAISRCAGDGDCIVRAVSRRTALPTDSIRRLLLLPPVTAVSPEEAATWFG